MISKVILMLLATGFLAMPARAQSNIVYAAEYNQRTNLFGTINLLNGYFNRISNFGSAVVNDIAYCPTNGALFAISNSTALVTFNPTNGTMLRIAPISTNGIESLAFRPSDSALFGATRSQLFTINITNGAATLVGAYGNARNLGSTGQNIRFAQDGNLYVSNTSTNTDIYRLNTTNGNATWMGEAIGYPYLILENGGTNMYGVYINLGSSTNPSPVLADFNLSSFVVGGTNANGSTHQITLNLVGAGTNFPANFNFSGNISPPVTNLTIFVSAVGPVSQSVCPGDSVTFTTAASGTGPYSYAWMKNNVTISGQTNSSLTLNNVNSSNAATYSVIVNGLMGSVTNTATLTVNVPVTITVPPTSQTSVVGSNATFSVTATGTGLSYQWLFGGSVIGTSSALTLNSVTTDQAGVYTVIVSGACGSPATNSATLTVNVPVTVTVPPVNQTTLVGGNATFSVTATGTSLSYQWLFNGLIIGTSSSLTLNNVTTGQAGVYTVIVSGAAGNPVTNSATLTVNVPVTVTVPPVSQTTLVGSNVTFSVTAVGTGLNYQWLFNGSVIGASSILTLNNVTTGQAGVYTVIVSGAAGNPVTNSATLTVNVPVTVTVPPVSQTTLVGSNVTFSVTAIGTGLSYQWLFGGSVIGTSSSLMLNNVTTGQAGVYTVIVSGAGSPVTNSASLTVDVPVTATALTNLVCCQGDNAAFSTVASGTGPFNYVWLKNGSVISGQNNNCLALNNVSTNDTAAYCVIVNGPCDSVTNSATLTVNLPAPPALSVVCQGDGSVKVTALGGVAGQQLVFQYSTDLFNWTAISTNTVDSSGLSTFISLTATNYQCCFYRTVTQ